MLEDNTITINMTTNILKVLIFNKIRLRVRRLTINVLNISLIASNICNVYINKKCYKRNMK